MKNRLSPFASALLVIFGGLMGTAWGQVAGTAGGDQIVDGIGETSLIARYPLDGTTNDRSRDSHHARLQGNGGTYVQDETFGRVLSLADGACLQLPGDALRNADSLSVVGWVLLRGDGGGAAGQRFFDFGKSARASFYCTPLGENANDGYRARITTSGAAGEQGPGGPRIATDKWVHLAVVLDAATKTLTIYADGAQVGQTKELKTGLEQVLDPNNSAANHLYIGRSQAGPGGGLNAKLHDLRLYSVALSDAQVGTIHKNALAGGPVVAAAAPGGQGEGPARATAAVAAGPKLVGVVDITATTTVGTLPKLPVLVAGTYEHGAKGPLVRVIWPSPRDNKEVLSPGTYTVTGKVPGTNFTPRAKVTVAAATAQPSTPARNLETFALGQVVLNKDEAGRDTPFMKNRDKFVRTLAGTNPDNFLYMFRDAFGQPQPEGARPLGGWDSQTTRLRGHATGHYLSALAQAYASSSYDAKLKATFAQKMNYMIDTLYDLSQKSGNPTEPGGPVNADPTKVPPGRGRAGYDSNLTAGGIRTDYWNWGKGFLSAYPPDQFIMLENGATYGGSNNQIWAPYYTLHKILAGLLDCYEVGGNEKALEVARGMGLWTYERLKVVPTETRIKMWNRYIAGEYGGMNEVMARLNRLTKDSRFLEAAKLFDNIDFFYGNVEHAHGLAKNVDTLRGKHANQHIPQITGALETYRDSGELVYFSIADNFWDITTSAYTYSIGGVAGAAKPNNAECFPAEPNTLWENGFNRGGQNETCATYNMLKLTRQLFLYAPEGRYMDYYEGALYNDILASVAEDNPGNTYHIPLNPGSRKQFGNANMSGFTCCNGTALESSTKLQDSIYFRSADNSALYVNLFVPSTLSWDERKTMVKQQTNYPYADTTKLTITGGSTLDLHARVPGWATKGFFVKVNGVERSVSAKPGEYVNLGRGWKDTDVIELRMPFSFHLDRVMDQPNIASILWGPVVLAAEETAARSDWRPVTLDVGDPGKSITGDPATLRFKVGDAVLKPFYETYGRYSVYFDMKME
jgi:DUF1680 family protein